MLDFAKNRRLMVDNQLRTFDVTHREILAAVDDLPREAFVLPGQEALAYADAALPLGQGGRMQLPPMVLARLLQLMSPSAGDRCLVVGGSFGYGAALLAQLGVHVTLVEEPSLAQEATRRLAALGVAGVVVKPGALEAGDADGAPFDGIILEGGFGVLPDGLLDQLADDGRLVGIDLGSGAPRAAIYTRSERSVGARAPFDAAAPMLPGFSAAPAFVF